MSDTPTFAGLPPRPDSRHSQESQESDISEKQADDCDTTPLLQDVKQSTQQSRKVKGETNAADESTNTVEEVRYVLSGQPTGWAAMAETVRAYDEEKVKDCKEDIDTLLVFAGLFSAVLTAFLVESYSNLQPNTESRMLLVLQQIALQTASYNMLNGMLNSTAQPPMNITGIASQPFQPTDNDIRVNVLWFSSLIFSLVTASFGMLVKQWLREYIAVENPSPQARLRIRRFRYPELMKWNVFEIAAVLPVLQQIALALFFIGLCYFTASVHESVGHTSLPLVAGWAFCFSTVTILPVFFPRCPYKTTLLKHLLQAIHMGSVAAATKCVGVLVEWHVMADARTIRDYALRWTISFGILLSNHSSNSDEQKAIVAEKEDLDILVDVDALQSNDELLGTTILESLHQVQPDWKNVVNFVLRVLEHRLQRDDLASGDPTPLDLRVISRQGYNAIIDILSNYSTFAILQYAQSDQAVTRWQNAPETMSAFYLLFSPARSPMPKAGLDVLREVMQYKGTELCRALSHKCPHHWRTDLDDKFYLLIEGFTDNLDNLDINLALSLQYYENMISTRLADAKEALIQPGQNSNVMFPDSSVLFAVHGDLEAWPWRQVMSQEGRLAAARFMIYTVRRALRQMRRAATTRTQETTAAARPKTAVVVNDAVHPPSRLVDALVGMWHMAEVGKIEEFSRTHELRFRSAIEESLAMRQSTCALLSALARVKSSVIVKALNKVPDGRPVVPGLLLEDPQQKLGNFIDAVGDLSQQQLFAESVDLGRQPITTLQVLIICYVALHMVELPDALQFKDQWKGLFSALTRLGNKTLGLKYGSYSTARLVEVDSVPHGSDCVSTHQLPYTIDPDALTGATYEECQDLVKRCLAKIQQEDTRFFRGPDWEKDLDSTARREAFNQWLGLFRMEDTVFEDDFVEMLGKIYDPPGLDLHGSDEDELEYFRWAKLKKSRPQAAMTAGGLVTSDRNSVRSSLQQRQEDNEVNEADSDTSSVSKDDNSSNGHGDST